MEHTCIHRELSDAIKESVRFFSVITVTGPVHDKAVIYAGSLENTAGSIKLLNYTHARYLGINATNIWNQKSRIAMAIPALVSIMLH